MCGDGHALLCDILLFLLQFKNQIVKNNKSGVLLLGLSQSKWAHSEKQTGIAKGFGSQFGAVMDTHHAVLNGVRTHNIN